VSGTQPDHVEQASDGMCFSFGTPNPLCALTYVLLFRRFWGTPRNSE